MEPKFNLIKSASTADKASKSQVDAIITNLSTIAEHKNTTMQQLGENVTHLLANIASKADAGEPIKLMHINSVGAFLAGVEAIAQALPSSPDPVKRENSLRILATAGIGAGGKINDETFPIVNLGARKEERHKQMTKIVSDYMDSQVRGEPNGRELAQIARKLQMDVDRAMRSAAKPRPFAATGPSRSGTAPGSV
jgi:hypothetical protein